MVSYAVWILILKFAADFGSILPSCRKIPSEKLMVHPENFYVEMPSPRAAENSSI